MPLSILSSVAVVRGNTPQLDLRCTGKVSARPWCPQGAGQPQVRGPRERRRSPCFSRGALARLDSHELDARHAFPPVSRHRGQDFPEDLCLKRVKSRLVVMLFSNQGELRIRTFHLGNGAKSNLNLTHVGTEKSRKSTNRGRGGGVLAWHRRGLAWEGGSRLSSMASMFTLPSSSVQVMLHPTNKPIKQSSLMEPACEV